MLSVECMDVQARTHLYATVLAMAECAAETRIWGPRRGIRNDTDRYNETGSAPEHPVIHDHFIDVYA
jgi:hypothetical protein